MRATPWGAVAAFCAGLLLGYGLWGRSQPPDPALIARIDTVLVAGPATRDTIRVYVARSRAYLDSMARTDTLARRAAAYAALLRLAEDSLTALGDTAGASAVCGRRVAALEVADLRWRDATRQCALAVHAADSGRMVAEGRLNLMEPALADANAALKRVRPLPRWTVGALWAPGGAVPVGGWVARRVGPLVLQLEATDGPDEAATVRLGAGLGF